MVTEQLSKVIWQKAASPSCHPLKVPYPVGIWIPIKYRVLWTHLSQSRKRHLDRFSRFCTSAYPCPCAQHRQTDTQTCDSCSNKPTVCRLCGLKLTKKNWKVKIDCTEDPVRILVYLWTYRQQVAEMQNAMRFLVTWPSAARYHANKRSFPSATYGVHIT